MELGKLIFAAVVFLVILIFIMFPEARTLFSGITRVFIKDMASTPEGAAAIYSEKIDQAQDRYNKADNAYRIAAGKLSNAQRDMKNLKAKLEKVEAECESLVKANKMDLAQLKADEHEEIISDIERYKELIKAYEDAANTAKEAQEMCEKNLRKLKRESKEVVENMKVKKQLQEVYDDMDEDGSFACVELKELCDIAADEEVCRNLLTEYVLQNAYHPSILCWKLPENHADFAALIRELDSTRPVLF